MAADEAPTPSELIQHWRAVAENMGSYSPAAAGAMRVCADEMEAALRPRVLSDAEVSRLTDGTDDCDCGHRLSQHSASGCLALAEEGSDLDYCECLRETVDNEYAEAVRFVD